MRFLSRILVFLALALLQACGGGTKSQAPIVVSQVTASGTMIRSTTSTFVVSGIGVDRGIQIEVSGCDNLTPRAGGTGLAQAYSCFVTGALFLPIIVRNSTGETLIATVLNVSEPTTSVSQVAAQSTLSYGRTGTLVVSGIALDKGIQVSAPGCGTITSVTGGSSSSQSYVCSVKAAPNLNVSVSNSSGLLLSTFTVAVPLPQVTVVTNTGTFVLELNPTAAPITVNNFLKYTNDGFYSNLLFHRVISNFVIQGGGYLTGMNQRTATYPAITLESQNGLSNLRGTVAMARTSDPNSATSEFFVNVVDNTFLDYASTASPGYAVFGKVVSGLDVIDAIKAVPTGTVGAFSDVPLTDVVILDAAQTQ